MTEKYFDQIRRSQKIPGTKNYENDKLQKLKIIHPWQRLVSESIKGSNWEGKRCQFVLMLPNKYTINDKMITWRVIRRQICFNCICIKLHAKYDPTRAYRRQRDTLAKQRLNWFIIIPRNVTSFASVTGVQLSCSSTQVRTTGHFPRTTRHSKVRTAIGRSHVLNIQCSENNARPWHATRCLRSPRAEDEFALTCGCSSVCSLLSIHSTLILRGVDRR